jgi:hypothetical protein
MSPIERSGGGSGSGTGAGTEIAYSQITAPVNVVSLAEATGTTIISPGAITFDGAAVMCEFHGRVVLGQSTVSTDFLFVSLFEGATQIQRIGAFISNVAAATLFATFESVTLDCSFRFTPTAGSHTYTVTAFVNSTTGTPSVRADTGGAGGDGPAFVRFTKV